MRTELDILAQDELDIAKSLLGGMWGSFSAPHVSYARFSWDAMAIQTTSAAMELRVTLECRDFEGSQDEYSHLSIVKLPNLLNQSPTYPDAYFIGQGEIVQEVWLARDHLHAYRHGKLDYEYISDVGLAMKLSSMWISITKGSHGSELISFAHSTDRIELDIHPLQARWQNDLEWTYTYDREWILLAGTEVQV